MTLARLVLLAGLLCCTEAFAQAGTAADYLPGCRLNSVERLNSADDVIKAAHCGGAMYALTSSAPFLEPAARFCPPAGIRMSQVSQVVVRYFESVPHRQTEPYIPLALEALRREWPCR